MERNFNQRLEDHMRETDTKIQGLNALIIQSTSPRRSRPISPTPLPRGQTPPQDDEDDDIYGHPNPPRTYKATPKPFPPQDARVSTNPERFYANYPPLPSPQLPSRQQSRQPRGTEVVKTALHRDKAAANSIRTSKERILATPHPRTRRLVRVGHCPVPVQSCFDHPDVPEW